MVDLQAIVSYFSFIINVDAYRYRKPDIYILLFFFQIFQQSLTKLNTIDLMSVLSQIKSQWFTPGTALNAYLANGCYIKTFLSMQK